MRHVALLWLLSIAGCASATARESLDAIAGETLHADSVVVRVANRYGRPLTVFLTVDSVTSRLGDVAAGIEARYPMRAADLVGAGIAFAVTPPASNESMRTAPVAVQPGQIVRFDIAPRLIDSRVVVRWPPRCEVCADPLRAP